MAFEKGHKLAPGGARRGAGRKPNWYKAHCEELLRNRKLLPRLADIAEGKEIFKKRDQNGQYMSAADAAAQVMAVEKLMDRAWGKPKQEVEMSGDMTVNLINAIKEARAKRGLPL